MQNDKPDVFYASGLRFECTRCNRCCRHSPGYVFLSAADVERLARAKKVTPQELVRVWCRTVDVGLAKRISLREKPNYDCILWENGGCSEYEARPLQCRAFPFWGATVSSREEWDRQARECPGMNRGPIHTREEIEEWLAKREADRLLDA
ncbi:MAG TPA: YkgJ family cysteine cluster protein [Spirochaetia bacterium]